MKAWKKLGLASLVTLMGNVGVTVFAEEADYPTKYVSMDSSTFTNILFWLVLLIILSMFGYSIWRFRCNNTLKSHWRKVGLFFLTIISVFVLVLNFILNMVATTVNMYFSPSYADKEKIEVVSQQTKELVTEVQKEGTVLLENKNETLPLSSVNKVNLFGISSVSLIYGGTGSGAGDESSNITLQEGLEQAGFEVNSTLVDYYKENLPEKRQTEIHNLTGGDFSIKELDSNNYPSDLISEAKDFSDIAIVTFSRQGGEGGDLPMDMAEYNGDVGKHYLELQDVERSLLDKVKENFGTVIVLINSSNAMELGFLEEEGVDAALWIGGPGSTGALAIGKILSGEVNPSGRLVDTYAYDVTSSPAFYNQGNFTYSNISTTIEKDGKQVTEYPEHFLNYTEGIYVGYRYYETRFVDNATGKVDETAYAATVQYPFGYGLSYTEFSQDITKMTETDGQIEVEVKITNTGDVAGKEVAQVYYTAPYTVGGIEKSHVVLAGFEKTEVLEPGQSETVTISFDRDDMASYDYKGEKTYVLEKGNYEIKLMNNAHDVLDSEIYSVEKTEVLTQRKSDKAEVTNQFDDAAGDLVYVSRADWEGTLPIERTKDQEASDEIANALDVNKIVIENDSSDEDIVIKNNGLRLVDMIGLDYNDSKWDLLLEQLSVNDMKRLVGSGGYGTVEIKSIDKPSTVELDGPAGINGIFKPIFGTQLNSETVIASTWNTELTGKTGEALAKEALAFGVVGLYAPAVNIHRTPFSGRNFEYYSEDPLLSGKLASAVIQKASEQGVYTYLKHFVLNDQETNRKRVATWSNEQAIREIYLKAFEIPVKEGKTPGVMSSFNRIGTTWTGASYGLLTTVLREEWGFVGTVITDGAFSMAYMNVDQAIRAGNDLILNPLPLGNTVQNNNTTNQALRAASKNILYTIANSKAMEIYTPKTRTWMVVAIVANIIVVGLWSLGMYALSGKPKIKQKKGKAT
ncbi:TPA: glycoside hydrolase family 3 C-terminal domain-containing protein [Streptococcus suis]